MAMENILLKLRQKVERDYVSSGIIGLDGLYLALDSLSPNQNETQLAAELADALREIMDISRNACAEHVRFAGIATNKCMVLIRPLGSQAKYFCLLLLRKSGNVGKALLELERIEDELLAEIGDTASQGLPGDPQQESGRVF